MIVRVEQGLGALLNLNYRSGSKLLQAVEDSVKAIRKNVHGNEQTAIEALARELVTTSPYGQRNPLDEPELVRTARVTRELNKDTGGMTHVFSEPAHRARVSKVKDKVAEAYAFVGVQE